MNYVSPASTTVLPLVPPFFYIRDKLRQGHVIPFLGSGASLGKRTPPDTKWEKEQTDFLPKSNELADHLAKQTSFPPEEPTDLAKVAQYYNLVIGRKPLHDELHSIFRRDYPYTALHTYLAEVPVPLLIVTTNYDDLIERAFDAKGRAYDVVIHTTNRSLGERIFWRRYGEANPQEILPNKLNIDLQLVTVIYKMHGTVDRVEPMRDQYVITEDDYIDFLVRMTRNKAFPSIFAEPFQNRHILFLGYGLRDWNLRVVLSRIEKDLYRPKDITSWAIQDKPSPLEKEFWDKRDVKVYDMKIEEFVEKLR
ncbi:SIR2 family protein [candidate division KSB1 bacterium]|nr:SIR2 family protein [candidate division KSB1 bacterium]